MTNRIASVLVTLGSLASSSLAQGVRIVEPTGTANFATIQAAVDAASNGALILVGAGTYPGFTINGKELSIVGTAPSTVVIAGAVDIRLVPAGKSVVLSGLDVQVPMYGGSALIAKDCTGVLRFDRCSFTAGDLDYGAFCNYPFSCDPFLNGEAGARVSQCSAVGFSTCAFFGGDGESIPTSEDNCCAPGLGGQGLVTSQSTVALYDCALIGGAGGGIESKPGTGGTGASISGNAFASNCSFTGGVGGACFLWPAFGGGGTGGAGVVATPALREIGCSFVGGQGGFGNPNGAPGQPWLGLAPASYAGPARVADITPPLGPDLAFWSVDFAGASPESVYALGSPFGAVQLSNPFHGAWLVDRSALLPIVPLGSTDPMGALSTTVATGDVPTGSLFARVFAQVATRSGGTAYLGSSSVLFLLDRASGPDCNANGVSDFVDVVLGSVPDVNHNLVPDSCPGG